MTAARFDSPQFMRFLAVGVVNALNGTLFAYLYSLVMDANLAFVLGYVTALTISYFLNSAFVFRASSPSSATFASRCPTSQLPHPEPQRPGGLQPPGYSRLGGYTLAAIIGVPATFLLLKFFAFPGAHSPFASEPDGHSLSVPANVKISASTAPAARLTRSFTANTTGIVVHLPTVGREPQPTDPV